MIEIGKKQQLMIVKQVEFGVYLSEENNERETVLLPIRQVPENAKSGDMLEVFLYRDSKDRLIATTATPKVTLHETAVLKVSQVGTIGAFLDWGLEKDLFLPFKEQTRRVGEGEEHLVALYLDKSNRLCATMNVYEYLKMDSPYRKDDRVSGTVYQISDEFGAFVAVDNVYSALIARKELYGTIAIGDTVKARVIAVKPDGKLDLSVREKAYVQIAGDSARIMELLDNYGGVLPYNDKASPELIRQETQMSKNEFKRAVGNLLKLKRIEITESGIRKL